MAGTEDTNPKAAAAVNRLRRWAVTEGDKIFKWGTPGDYDRCRTFYKSKMPDKMIDGWCARLHHLSTGGWPGHAPGVETALAKAKAKGQG